MKKTLTKIKNICQLIGYKVGSENENGELRYYAQKRYFVWWLILPVLFPYIFLLGGLRDVVDYMVNIYRYECRYITLRNNKVPNKKDKQAIILHLLN